MNEIELSIVATCYNDAKIIPLLVQEIENSIKPLEINYEIILVNDFSPDNTEFVISKICKKNPNIKGISLAKNFGQQIAMSAGIRYTTGKFIVIMDGDLQNPPEAIPILLEKIKTEQKDIVYCISNTRNNLFDEMTSKIFWFVLTKIFNVKIVKNQLMMKIFTTKFSEQYNLYNESVRTVAGIMNEMSGHYSILKVENKKRKHGKSNYSFFKRVNLMLDILVSISNYPLNMMIYLGGILFVFTILISMYFFIQYFTTEVPLGFTSLILSSFFFGSLNLLLLGFIGKYLSNIYIEVRRRPLFHIKKTYNFKTK